MSGPQLLPGIPASHVLARLAQAGGKEVESGKLLSPESSAALAVNCFGWFIERPKQLPSLKGVETAGIPELVDVEFCARFPWSGGRHPWLDAVVQTPTTLIGIESKRFEPFRDVKSVSLSDAYDRPVWGENMKGYERMRDRLRSGQEGFVHLDAAQLVKHAFGLVTEGRRRTRMPVLFYLLPNPPRGMVAPLCRMTLRGIGTRFPASAKRLQAPKWHFTPRATGSGSEPGVDSTATLRHTDRQSSKCLRRERRSRD